MKFTPEQIVQILETPLGKAYHIEDEVVLVERKRIHERYEELKWDLSFSEANIQARAWWLQSVINSILEEV